nr:L-rhamnose/proton symporter RhaT [uncultured Cohaesibacter sp.]
MEFSANLGIFYHLLGALAASSFYIPISMVKNWEWEASWFLNGIASWIIMPILISSLLLPDVGAFYASIPASVLIKTYLLGALWGIGGLTFGMTMRYLGLSVGYGVAIGITLVVGTLMPPIIDRQIGHFVSTSSGLIALGGVLLAVVGIFVCSQAGRRKEAETGEKSDEFNLRKGIIIAVICGILSAFMAFAIEAGQPMQDLAIKLGVDPLYQIMPSYVIIMLGGFTTNAIYCIYKARQNNTVRKIRQDRSGLVRNALLSMAGGVIWYLQFFFYGWGHVQMVGSNLGFISWTLHMSLLVFCGGLFGFLMKEWVGSSTLTRRIQYAGMCVIICSTIVIGIAAN